MKTNEKNSYFSGEAIGERRVFRGKNDRFCSGLFFYDKELLYHAAKESGLCEDIFEKADEKVSQGLSGYLMPMIFLEELSLILRMPPCQGIIFSIFNRRLF